MPLRPTQGLACELTSRIVSSHASSCWPCSRWPVTAASESVRSFSTKDECLRCEKLSWLGVGVGLGLGLGVSVKVRVREVLSLVTRAVSSESVS